MRTQETSDKHCRLNEKGLEKLNKALEKIFSCKPVNITDTGIENKTGVDREAVAKIRACDKPLTRSSLEKLFDPLHRILVEEHGIEYPGKLNIEKMQLEEKDYERITIRKSASKASNLDQTKNNSQLGSLETALFELNYKSQFDPFTNWVAKNNQIGAFLIQGEEKRGKQWLVNRLVKQKFREHYQTDKLIPILVPPPQENQDNHIDKFWKELGKKLELQSQPTAENCVKKAFKRWQSGSLIMAFYADNIYQDIHKIIDDFWKPLVEQTPFYIEEEGIESYLLMFLIDSRDRISQSGIEMVDSDNQTNWHPQKLMALPKIDNFGQSSDEILLSWCKTHRNLLKCPENLSRVTVVTQQIWDNSKGVPESTFEAIGKIVVHPSFSWSQFEKDLQYKL